jgi:hypothetical protein
LVKQNPGRHNELYQLASGIDFIAVSGWFILPSAVENGVFRPSDDGQCQKGFQTVVFRDSTQEQPSA